MFLITKQAKLIFLSAMFSLTMMTSISSGYFINTSFFEKPNITLNSAKAQKLSSFAENKEQEYKVFESNFFTTFFNPSLKVNNSGNKIFLELDKKTFSSQLKDFVLKALESKLKIFELSMQNLKGNIFFSFQKDSTIDVLITWQSNKLFKQKVFFDYFSINFSL